MFLPDGYLLRGKQRIEGGKTIINHWQPFSQERESGRCCFDEWGANIGDSEWPIAINVDRPKVLPKQQSDGARSRRSTQIVSVCCLHLRCFTQEIPTNVHMGQEERNYSEGKITGRVILFPFWYCHIQYRYTSAGENCVTPPGFVFNALKALWDAYQKSAIQVQIKND